MKGLVYNNGIFAGLLEKDEMGKYHFRYDDGYFRNEKNPPISLTLPKTQQNYLADELFPFFYGLLAEGVNKEIQCRLYRLDEDDDFARLLHTAGDAIGGITVKREET
jgi:serine/threonine-protein kinase HipA